MSACTCVWGGAWRMHRAGWGRGDAQTGVAGAPSASRGNWRGRVSSTRRGALARRAGPGSPEGTGKRRRVVPGVVKTGCAELRGRPSCALGRRLCSFACRAR